MASVNDVTQGMEIKSYQGDDVVPGINTENLVKKAPVIGDGVQTVKDAIGLGDSADGAELGMGIATICLDATTFVQSASSTIVDIATDPLGWLVGQGLSFLINVVQPVQDAIHFVSGDGPALGTAAENFGTIAKGLQEMAVNFADVADEKLAGWEGDAGDAARRGLGEFANGINGTAAKAGDLAQMLQISSMLMTFIEELIKAILTEVITWLIILWVPAIAAAVPTCGASTAAAGAATPPKVAATTGKTAKQVNKLRELLTKVLEWLRKMQAKIASTKLGKLVLGDGNAVEGFASRNGKGMVGSMWAEKGTLGKRIAEAPHVLNKTKDAIDLDASLRHGALRDTLEEAKGSVTKGVLGAEPGDFRENTGKAITDAAGKVIGYAKDGKKIYDYGEQGQDQSDEETARDLDF
jgi:hypothetical protein